MTSINPMSIQQAVENYLRDKRVGSSSKSVQTYDQGLRRFTKYLEETGIPLTSTCSALTVDHALECARQLSERGIAKDTLRVYLSAINNFYDWLLIEELIDPPSHDLKRMEVKFREFRKKHGEESLPKLPTDEEVQAILNAARSVEINPKLKTSTKHRAELERWRNIAIIEALRSSGMRVGELVGIKRGDVDWRKKTAVVSGKSGKRIVYFDKPAVDAMRKYLAVRADGATGQSLDELPLFAQHGKRGANRLLPITTHCVRHDFTALVEAAGIEHEITPHWLRHLFATKIQEMFNDLALTQDMLGHRSPETTRIYAKISNKRMRDAHAKAFPD